MTASQLEELPLNDPLVLAEPGTNLSVPVATAAPTADVVRDPIVVSIGDDAAVGAVPGAFASVSSAPAVAAGFVVFHPPSCGFEWITDPSGNSWRVANGAAGSFEPPDDWVPALTTAGDVRMVATANDFGTVFVRPDGVATTVEYRSTPARVICH